IVSRIAVRPMRISLPIEADPSTIAAGAICFSAARNEPFAPVETHQSIGFVMASSGVERNRKFGGERISVVTSQFDQLKPKRRSWAWTSTLTRRIASQKFGIARQTIPPNEAK